MNKVNIRNDSESVEAAYAERQELHVRVLMVQSTFQRTRSILRLGGLGPYLIAYFEVKGDILRTSWKELRCGLVCKCSLHPGEKHI
jgi:hypothetical protein